MLGHLSSFSHSAWFYSADYTLPEVWASLSLTQGGSGGGRAMCLLGAWCLGSPWHMEQPGAGWVWLKRATVILRPFSEPGNRGADGEGISPRPARLARGRARIRAWLPGLLMYLFCLWRWLQKTPKQKTISLKHLLVLCLFCTYRDTFVYV